MRIWLLIVLMGLVSLMGCKMVSEEPVFEVVVENEGDVVETAVTPGTLTVDITSESGIGSANVELVGGEWPETVVFRVYTKGLENFTLTYGETAVTVSVTSSGLVLNSVVQDGVEQSVDVDSDFSMPVRVEADYFEVEAPADFHKSGSDAFAIGWIDFYR